MSAPLFVVPTSTPSERARSASRPLLLLLCFFLTPLGLGWAGPVRAAETVILCYHRFGPTVADSMTTRTSVFEQQLARLKSEGYQFVTLDAVIDGLRGRAPLPDKAVALTIDDGHITVYAELLPIIRREHLPVTLFIYPSAISNASYAMTWDQLREMKDTGLVAIQSHTYWHPNFKTERKRLDDAAYAKLVKVQLEKPRAVLNQRLGVEADVLAWPFGIHDPELEAAAVAAGYRASLALGERRARDTDPPQALPRFLIADATGVNGLANLIRKGGEISK
jgi:peptidoglycan/xylan/chitin deacetylase (PgdA/CDA1 family)